MIIIEIEPDFGNYHNFFHKKLRIYYFQIIKKMTIIGDFD